MLIDEAVGHEIPREAAAQVQTLEAEVTRLRRLLDEKEKRFCKANRRIRGLERDLDAIMNAVSR
jgi:peptidoglycan hydrolase CwlO-like protein